MPKYCPKCGHSFPEDWDECNECEVELVYEEKDRVIELSEMDKKYYDYKSRVYLDENSINKSSNQNLNIPHCPTCQSENIEKISTADKIGGAILFGLFSNTAKSQFKCKNCGYKW